MSTPLDQSWQQGRDPFVRETEARYRLDAPLRFATVTALRGRGLELIAAAAPELTIDLSRVPSADSAGLALLVDWLARARASDKVLRYAEPPATLRSLAQLSDVERLIMA